MDSTVVVAVVEVVEGSDVVDDFVVFIKVDVGDVVIVVLGDLVVSVVDFLRLNAGLTVVQNSKESGKVCPCVGDVELLVVEDVVEELSGSDVVSFVVVIPRGSTSFSFRG